MCVLRIVGNEKFKPDDFKPGWTIKPVKVHRRGGINIVGKRNNISGLVYDVSSKDKLEDQIKDAIRFLKKHNKHLKGISGHVDVDTVALDFLLLRPAKGVAVINKGFSAELVQLAGKSNIALWFSQWLV